MLGAPSAPSRKSQVRLGVWIELTTILWMTIEASVALSVGFATRSVSLQGFGMDSIVELIAGGILLWRLLVEQRGGSVERIEQAERRSAWVTAISLFALAVYIVGDSALTLLTHMKQKHPGGALVWRLPLRSSCLCCGKGNSALPDTLVAQPSKQMQPVA